MSKEAAFDYMRDCMRIDLRMRICDERVDTFVSMLQALAALTNFFRAHTQSLAAWQKPITATLRPMTWSDKQQEFLDIVADRINIRDSSDLAGGLAAGCTLPGVPVAARPR